ncbi:DUF4846 domain-containing protein [Neolewinella agarilytica]|uniref:DUF4846 domain-containing protein n=1 Tax=Neolewinella agarilytica TaxID=478744 RepID=UPI00235213E8|nr:DUF4846 domain-containing protein [Neolewinella agarilytica]
MRMLCLLFSLLTLIACGEAPAQGELPESLPTEREPFRWINTEGATIATRFSAPESFVRRGLEENTFGHYLRFQPLKPDGTEVHLFSGAPKANQTAHAAVLDLDVGQRDLQQCADAIMRLRAEYLFAEKRYNDIHFNFVSGFKAEYSRWRAGERISVKGNRVSWTASRGATPGYTAFRKYLTMVFSYAGTASLVHELKPKPVADILIGDVFIRGGSPGHAVIVVDRVVQPEKGEVRVLLAQSYMPAQDIHVLRNPSAQDGSPWYTVADFGEGVLTPEWRFRPDELRTFQ